MLRKILETIGTRYLVALLNLALIFINAKILGIAGVGMVGLVVASINIAIIFNGILSGGTLVYFMNRYSMRTILPLAYLWNFVGSALACAALAAVGMLPRAYEADIYLLAILNSLVTANSRFLLGNDRVKGFNLTFLLQGGSLFFLLLFLYYGLRHTDVRAYVWGLYLANGIALVVSTALLVPLWRREKSLRDAPPLPRLLREMFAYGLWAGADSLAETLTTRLNYFLIERFCGLGCVGLLDAGTKMSESVWHISRSVSFIEYSQVAKTTDAAEQKRVTLRLFKLTLGAMALVMGGIAAIPEWCLSTGIVALGCNSVVGHYFIGSGKIPYSAACSGIGLAVLLVAGLFLIPPYGTLGAAISTSVAFTAMLAFSLVQFARQTATTFREFLPNRSDWAYLRQALRRAKA